MNDARDEGEPRATRGLGTDPHPRVQYDPPDPVPALVNLFIVVLVLSIALGLWQALHTPSAAGQ